MAPLSGGVCPISASGRGRTRATARGRARSGAAAARAQKQDEAAASLLGILWEAELRQPAWAFVPRPELARRAGALGCLAFHRGARQTDRRETSGDPHEPHRPRTARWRSSLAGARGIGRAIAETAVGLPARGSPCGTSTPPPRNAPRTKIAGAAAFQADVTDPASIEAALVAAEARLGPS